MWTWYKDVLSCYYYLFFWIFQSEKTTVPSTTSFNPNIHLTWSDVSVDNVHFLRVKLKKSKTNQLGNGTDVYVGRTDSPLCPVGAGLDYMAAHGSDPGPFIRFSDESPLTKSKLTAQVCEVLQTLGLPYTCRVCWTQLWGRSSNSCGKSRNGGFSDMHTRQME